MKGQHDCSSSSAHKQRSGNPGHLRGRWGHVHSDSSLKKKLLNCHQIENILHNFREVSSSGLTTCTVKGELRIYVIPNTKGESLGKLGVPTLKDSDQQH